MADTKLIDLTPASPLDGTELFYSVQAGNDVKVELQNIVDFIGVAAVDSVNGQTGVVVLDADDIDDTSTTNKFVTAADLTVLSNTSGTNTGDQSLFSTIAVSGQSNVVADTTTDTLTLVAGSNITITTDATTDSITIAASGGSGSPAGSDTQVQFNDSGSFGADADFTYNKTTNALTIGGLVHTPIVQAHTSAGLILEAQGGADVLLIGAGGGVNATAYGGWNFDTATVSTLASFGASKTLSSLSTAIYPDLTEISYVKGVTSAIQTQINAKISASSTDALTNKTLNLTSNTLTGTKAQFDTACSDGNFLYVGDVTQYTDEQAQDAVGAMVDGTLIYTDGTPLLSRAALTGAITASAGSNATSLGSFTTSQLNTALSDNDVATLAGSESLTNKKLGSLTTNGFVKTSSSDGTLSVDTIAYGSTGFNFIINGNGSTITTGNKNGFAVPFNCTITAVTMGADQSGSIVVDIWKDTYANYPPTVADTITASAKPTISSTTKSTDSTLTGWTKTLTAGDWLFFNVDSVTSIQKVCIYIAVTRT